MHSYTELINISSGLVLDEIHEVRLSSAQNCFYFESSFPEPRWLRSNIAACSLRNVSHAPLSSPFQARLVLWTFSEHGSWHPQSPVSGGSPAGWGSCQMTASLILLHFAKMQIIDKGFTRSWQAKMTEKDPELTSSHQHNKIPTICRATINEKDSIFYN